MLKSGVSTCRILKEKMMPHCLVCFQLQVKDGCETEDGVWCSFTHACPEGGEKQSVTASGQHAWSTGQHTARWGGNKHCMLPSEWWLDLSISILCSLRLVLYYISEADMVPLYYYSHLKENVGKKASVINFIFMPPESPVHRNVF